jgi:hypothetical protein
MIQFGKLVQPLLNFYRDQVFENNIVQMDETSLQVLKEPDKSSTSKSYMWVQRGGPPGKTVILYDYAPTRAQTVPLNLLKGYRGYLQVDGYEGYNAIGRENDVTLVGCWAHARRKFMDAVKAQKKSVKTGFAHDGVLFIKKLYRIDKETKERPTGLARQRYRCEQAQPILDEIRDWLDQALVRVPPKTNTGKALHYLNGQWTKLTRFLENGDISLDNNAVENAIRPFAVGRKNWLFSDTPNGAHASANLYSLIETAKVNDWEPYEYLKIVAEKIPSATTADDIENLMPWNLEIPAK